MQFATVKLKQISTGFGEKSSICSLLSFYTTQQKIYKTKLHQSKISNWIVPTTKSFECVELS